LGLSAAGLSNNEMCSQQSWIQVWQKTVGETVKDAHIYVELTCFNASLVVGSLSSRLGHGF
jgi:hypothetical protein